MRKPLGILFMTGFIATMFMGATKLSSYMLRDRSREYEGRIGDCDVAREQGFEYLMLYGALSERTTVRCDGSVTEYIDREPLGSLDGYVYAPRSGKKVECFGGDCLGPRVAERFSELYEAIAVQSRISGR